MNRLLLIVLTLILAFSGSPAFSKFSSDGLKKTSTDKRQQGLRDDEIKITQRRGYGFRPRYRNNYNRQLQQQRMQQQRLRQQQQRQRMQQQRRQQQAQRRRMMEQRRRQQAAMRKRQQQMRLQRQRIAQQRRLVQQRQRQKLQRVQSQKRIQQQGTKQQVVATQRVMKSRMITAAQTKKLRLLRNKARRLKDQREKARKSKNISLAASMRAPKVSALSAPKRNSRISNLRSNLKRLKLKQNRTKGVSRASKKLAKNTAKVEALTKRFKRCIGKSCVTGGTAKPPSSNKLTHNVGNSGRSFGKLSQNLKRKLSALKAKTSTIKRLTPKQITKFKKTTSKSDKLAKAKPKVMKKAAVSGNGNVKPKNNIPTKQPNSKVVKKEAKPAPSSNSVPKNLRVSKNTIQRKPSARSQKVAPKPSATTKQAPVSAKSSTNRQKQIASKTAQAKPSHRQITQPKQRAATVLPKKHINNSSTNSVKLPLKTGPPAINKKALIAKRAGRQRNISTNSTANTNLPRQKTNTVSSSASQKTASANKRKPSVTSSENKFFVHAKSKNTLVGKYLKDDSGAIKGGIGKMPIQELKAKTGVKKGIATLDKRVNQTSQSIVNDNTPTIKTKTSAPKRMPPKQIKQQINAPVHRVNGFDKASSRTANLAKSDVNGSNKQPNQNLRKTYNNKTQKISSEAPKPLARLPRNLKKEITTKMPDAKRRIGKHAMALTEAMPKTHFVADQIVYLNKDRTKFIVRNIDLKPTLERIVAGKKFPHKNDSRRYRNKYVKGKGRLLPEKEDRDYYKEYVHPTPGVEGPGEQRIIVGKEGEVYYTPDHYDSRVRLK